MSNSEQYTTSTQGDGLERTGTKDRTELTDDELSKVVGGVTEIVVTKRLDSSTPNLN
jgi:bacteriocin-like protein